jgi:DNA-binding MarR family transcriptional regulator
MPPSRSIATRQDLLRRLWDLGRQQSTQTVFLHQALAQQVGLNATDTKCVDLMLPHPEGVTPGWLADRSGLTTGAVTHIVDRLERRGIAERQRDVHDRRKVLVRVRPESLAPLIPEYERIGHAFSRVFDDYTDDEIRLITRYSEDVARVSTAELARIVAERRAQSKETVAPSKRPTKKAPPQSRHAR